MSSEPRAVPRAPADPAAEAPLGPLFNQLARDSAALIRQEVALAKAELRQSARQTARGAMKLGVALAVVSVGALVLTAFLVLLLGDLLGNYWLAALIVGAVYTLIGAVLALTGARTLKTVEMAPQETIETLKEDRDWARAEIQDLKRELKS